MVAMGRKLLADPELPRKLQEDRASEIRPCVYCYVCVAQAFFDRSVRCAVNPVTAHETELCNLGKTLPGERKHILIAGGGPAGMEAARIATIRGHRVTLYEKSSRLGGALRFGAVVYEPNERLLHWYESELARLQVEICLGVEVDAALVKDVRPDTLILSHGAAKSRPRIPGIDQNHVLDGEDLRSLLTGEGDPGVAKKISRTGRLAIRVGRAVGLTTEAGRIRKASHAYMPVGQNIVVLGGDLVGCEIAEFLAERGRHVTVLEAGATPARQMAHPRRFRVLHELEELGVDVRRHAIATAITASAVHHSQAAADGTQSKHSIRADTVIIASGLLPSPDLATALEGLAPEVHVLGDATGVEYLEGAIRDGFHTARSL